MPQPAGRLAHLLTAVAAAEQTRAREWPTIRHLPLLLGLWSVGVPEYQYMLAIHARTRKIHEPVVICAVGDWGKRQQGHGGCFNMSFAARLQLWKCMQLHWLSQLTY